MQIIYSQIYKKSHKYSNRKQNRMEKIAENHSWFLEWNPKTFAHNHVVVNAEIFPKFPLKNRRDFRFLCAVAGKVNLFQKKKSPDNKVANR